MNYYVISTLTLFFTINSCFDTGSVYVVGDSHTRPFHQFLSNVYWLGPITMHRVGRDGLDSLVAAKYLPKKNDLCVCVFGEIDIRVHVFKQVYEHQRVLQEVIETLVHSFIKSLCVYRNTHEKLIIAVACITPPTNAVFNPDYPYRGSLDERIAATKQINALLKNTCKENGFYFLDYAQHYALPSGELNPQYSDGNVHIQYPHFIQISLENIFAKMNDDRT